MIERKEKAEEGINMVNCLNKHELPVKMSSYTEGYVFIIPVSYSASEVYNPVNVRFMKECTQ